MKQETKSCKFIRQELTRLAQLMKKKNINIETLAYDLEVSREIVKKWVLGDLSPRLLHAIKLVNYFGRSLKIEDLLKPSDKLKLGA